MALTAQEFIELKERVDAEMKRRKYYGSLEEFGNLDWIPEQPSVGRLIHKEQGAGVIDNALRIEDIEGLALVREGDIRPQYDDLKSKLAQWESEKNEDETITPETTSSCRGACTGLCTQTCFETCLGCTSCSGGCGDRCTGTCFAACVSACETACSGCSGSSW